MSAYVGLVVLFYPAAKCTGLAAIVAGVNDDDTLNLTVFHPDNGAASGVQNVALVDAETRPEEGPYVELLVPPVEGEDEAAPTPYRRPKTAKKRK